MIAIKIEIKVVMNTINYNECNKRMTIRIKTWGRYEKFVNQISKTNSTTHVKLGCFSDLYMYLYK